VQAAARLDDPIAHTGALDGLVKGALAGALAGAAWSWARRSLWDLAKEEDLLEPI
jgi:hypothetical protein